MLLMLLVLLCADVCSVDDFELFDDFLWFLLISSNTEKLDVLDDEFLRDVHDEYAELLIEFFFVYNY